MRPAPNDPRIVDSGKINALNASGGAPDDPHREINLLEVPQVARRLGVSKSTVIRLIKNGKFRGAKQYSGRNGKYLIPEDEVSKLKDKGR